MNHIRDVLTRSRTIAVVGLSAKPDRASFQVASYLQAHGYRIIPINPRETSVLGEVALPSLRDVQDHIDVVNVFRESNAVPAIVDDTIAIAAPVLWLQLDIHHAEAEARASQHGITVITDSCIKVVHQQLMQ